MSTARPTEMIPTTKVVRAPTIKRLRMSMPNPSVPNTCGHPGGNRRSEGTTLIGSNGVQKTDTTAVMTINATNTSPATSCARFMTRPRGSAAEDR